MTDTNEPACTRSSGSTDDHTGMLFPSLTGFGRSLFANHRFTLALAITACGQVTAYSRLTGAWTDVHGGVERRAERIESDPAVPSERTASSRTGADSTDGRTDDRRTDPRSTDGPESVPIDVVEGYDGLPSRNPARLANSVGCRCPQCGTFGGRSVAPIRRQPLSPAAFGIRR